MILEGLVTTLNDDGSVNLSPMGPLVRDEMRQLVLRLFPDSRTCRNVVARGQGIFHVTDDVELLARAAIGAVEPLPPLEPARRVEGFYLADACRWYAFRVRRIDRTPPRWQVECDVVEQGRVRDFFGFNRAKHAVVEAAILATRLHLLPRDAVAAELDRLRVLVDKTGGPQEIRAWRLLSDYVQQWWVQERSAAR